MGYRSYGRLINPIKKMGFLPSCSCVHTTVWMQHVDANKMHGEKNSVETTQECYDLS